MFVEHLSLTDFRCYRSAELELRPGVVLFVGANGQGKTNLVEAVEYVSTLGSHRVSNDAPLVRAGAEQAIVRAQVRAGLEDERSLSLEVEINPGRANRVRINRNATKPRDLVGVLRTVVFAPDDLRMVKGDPADRRRFLDEVVVTRWPRMAGVKADYERVLRQRNQLLKTLAARRGGDDGTLEVWDERLAQVGAELLSARLDTLAELMPHAAQAYADIAPVNNTAAASYQSSVDRSHPDGPSDTHDRAALQTRLREAILARRNDELVRGLSLVGPHRDEIALTIGDLPARGYASHGESWSLALSLRLGSFNLLRADSVEPVLVLDDVFAELDQTRRSRLADAVREADQVLVTAAVASDVPDALDGDRFQVSAGSVSASEPRQAHDD